MNGDDGKKLSKRHGAVAIDAFREDGYIPAAMMNFLALLGWSFDDKTTVMSPDELVERFSLERVGPSPATFDYQKLDWLNGVHLRELSEDAYAAALLTWLARAGDRLARGAGARRPCRSSRRRSRSSRSTRTSCASCSSRSRRAARTRPSAAPRPRRSARSIRGRRPGSRRRSGTSPRPKGLKPREAFAPIRLAVTGSKISPGLFESLELLGRDESLARLRPIEQ